MSAIKCFFDGTLELVDRGWLGDPRDDGLIFNDYTSSVWVTGYQNDRNSPLGNDFGGRQAVHHRHIEIDKRDIDFHASTLVDQLLAVADGAYDLIPHALEQAHESLSNVGLVLCHGDANL
jgi:hypothetical protein